MWLSQRHPKPINERIYSLGARSGRTGRVTGSVVPRPALSLYDCGGVDTVSRPGDIDDIIRAHGQILVMLVDWIDETVLWRRGRGGRGLGQCHSGEVEK